MPSNRKLQNGGRSMVLTKAAKKVHDYGVLVMFSHTIFSLSFALIAMLLASSGSIQFEKVFWILVCFLSARTGANAINRVIDAKIDAQNPRTADRQIPRGVIAPKEVVVFTAVCFLIMAFGAYKLNPLCLALSPIAYVFMIGYSYTKRFTWLCHVVLGATSAMAPVGAWLAVTGRLSVLPILFGVANTFWVAGFDILYGAQDYAFDTANGLHSIPARFGVKGGLAIAKGFHIVAMSCLVAVGFLANALGAVYFVAIGIVAGLFVLQHKMVSETNLTLVKLASYSVNQVISMVFLAGGLMDILWL